VVLFILDLVSLLTLFRGQLPRPSQCLVNPSPVVNCLDLEVLVANRQSWLLVQHRNPDRYHKLALYPAAEVKEFLQAYQPATKESLQACQAATAESQQAYQAATKACQQVYPQPIWLTLLKQLLPLYKPHWATNQFPHL
jgi:hypothetical protein